MPDPNGDIVERGTGRRWREVPGSRRDPSLPGSSGHGYTEFEVVALEPGVVPVAVNSYVMTGGDGAPNLMGHAAALAGTGACDLWVNPTALKKVKSRDADGLKVFRMAYKLGGQSQPAVWFQFTSGRGYTLLVYDEATGVMLHNSSSAKGRESPLNVYQNGVLQGNTSSTTLTMGTLVAQRQLTLPWLGGSAPQWIARPQPLDYQGTFTAIVPGSPNIPLSFSLTMRPIAHGPDWVKMHVTTAARSYLNVPPSTSESEQMDGTGHIGLWIPPDALGKLQRGQRLDSDRVTNMVTTVAGTGRSPTGGEMTVLSLSSPAQQIDMGYDRATGMLVFIRQQDRQLHTDVQVGLRGGL